jgi:ParB/RepB/Spo0J family partition protein
MSTHLITLPAPAPAPSDRPIVVDELVMSDGSTFGQFSLGSIRISRTNRKRFDAEKLAQLSASIKAKGVAQPILIRPVTPTAKEPQQFEIVAGERRFRASVMAELERIPAISRTLSDHDALELQILENLQREDPHPQEEAEGYQQLMMSHGYTADQLAERLNKSRSYIYGRLKLCALTLEVREQFLDNIDVLPASTALLIARIPVPKLQTKALGEILKPQHGNEPMSVRAARNWIEARYTLALDQARFEPGDGKLLAKAGSCARCPKRTGNDPVLYPDVDKNICTDPDCFAEKNAAHDERIIRIATKENVPVLEGAEATATLGDLTSVFGDAGLWKLDRLAPNVDRMALLSAVLSESQLPPAKAIVKLDNGKVRKLYDKANLQQAAEKAGVCLSKEAWDAQQATAAAAPTAIAKREREEEAAAARVARLDRAKRETATRVAIYRQFRHRGIGGLTIESLRALAKLMVSEHSIPDDLIGDLYPFEDRSDHGVCAYIDQAGAGEVQTLMLDMLLGECLGVETWQLVRGDEIESDEGYKTLLTIAAHEEMHASDEPLGAGQVEGQTTNRSKITLKPRPTSSEAAEEPQGGAHAPEGPVVKVKQKRVVPAAQWPFPSTKNQSI